MSLIPVFKTKSTDKLHPVALDTIRRNVFFACKNGDLKKIRSLLQDLETSEIDQVIHAKTNSATPLVIASKSGHLPIIRFLVRECSADIEQTGSVVFDGEAIEYAPPLWCAAAAGHLPVVKFLIQHGAKVNNTTKTNSTPLRAACFDGHLEVVRYLVQHNANIEIANQHGHTCLMIVCYKGHIEIAKYLLRLGANTNKKSAKGNTALHDCAEAGHLNIMKLLLEHGAIMQKDCYGVTPLISAAANCNTQIVNWIANVVTGSLGQPLCGTPFSHVKKVCEMPEVVNALELLGATVVDKKKDLMMGHRFWCRAMNLRLSAPTPIEKVLQPPVPAYDNAIELINREQLNEIIADPDAMRMQSLLIRERVLGIRHPDTSYYIRYRGAMYADNGDFERCTSLWMYALKLHQICCQPLNIVTISSMLSFAELFLFMSQTEELAASIRFQDVYNVIEAAVSELESGMLKRVRKTALDDHMPAECNTFHRDRAVVTLMHLFCIVCLLESRFSDSQMHSFKQLAYNFLKMGCQNSDGSTPLHLACSHETSFIGKHSVCSFPSPALVKFFIELGADPNSRDLDANTPLHILVASIDKSIDSKKELAREISEFLLNNGAHIDSANLERVTPISPNSCVSASVNVLHFTTLQCLSARVLTKYGISYKDTLSVTLKEFVDMH